ncbi:MAG: hypothetical protein NVS4B12_04520 [Ktedonobacteraceae bacterium]
MYKSTQQVRDQQPDTTDIIERYRITSLMRRSAFTQVFLAVDTLHKRPVVIRDIDIDSLNDDAKQQALKAVQHEYDLLRRQRIPDVMPLIDLRYSREHIFAVGGWPFPLPENDQDGNSKASTQTLQDLLQSGMGLPSEHIALTWLYRLSAAIGRLHNLDIVLGDIDPTTIVVSHNTYHGIPALTVSWLPLPIRTLLGTTSSSANGSRFMAPEARHGAVESRSDIYSLGALLYLLLTGSTPDEPSSSMQRPWHSLREFSPRVAGSVEAIVMRALSVDVSNRFQRVEEMEEALLLAIEQLSETHRVRPTAAAQKKGKRGALSNGQDIVSEPNDTAEEVTVSIVSLQSQLARMYLEKMQPGQESFQDEQSTLARGVIADTPTISTAHIHNVLLQQAIETPLPVEDDEVLPDDEPLPEPMPRATPVPTSGTTGELPLMQRFRESMSGVLPALRREPTSYPAAAPSSAPSRRDTAGLSLLKRLQRFLLSEQQHSTTAAALIETPLRVQPNQGYAIRIHLTGRELATPPPGSKKGTQPVGLSALVHDEMVHVEVRSAIFQNYAYVVQRADVHIPGQGFAAEITIPMQPLSEGTGGRRERLHIFFMDEMRRPLYEKPFAVEVFVSRLVQSGREGHNVLTIPL